MAPNCVLVSRNRRHRQATTPVEIPGRVDQSLRNASRSSAYAVTGVSAVASAVRGLPSRAAISPNRSPAAACRKLSSRPLFGRNRQPHAAFPHHIKMTSRIAARERHRTFIEADLAEKRGAGFEILGREPAEEIGAGEKRNDDVFVRHGSYETLASASRRRGAPQRAGGDGASPG